MPYLLGFHFVCLVETFLEYFESSLVSLDFTVYVSPAKKLSHLGRRSGGVICLVKHTISPWVKHIKCDLDNLLVFRLDKQLFNSEKDVLMLCAYIPPSGSPYYDNKSVSNGIYLLEEYLLQLYAQHDDCSIVVCGDLNARTGRSNVGNQSDYSNMREDVFSNLRNSQDPTTNEFGRSLLSLCLGFELRILNGGIEGDRVGAYTYISQTGNSVIDYILVSEDFIPYCKSLVIKENVLTSHLCLELKLLSEIGGDVSEVFQGTKLVWDATLSETYVENLSTHFSKLLDEVDTCTFTTDVDTDVMCYEITMAFVQSAECMRKRVSYGMKKHGQPWFDRECKSAKSKLQSLLRLYRRTLLYPVKQEYIKCRNKYKIMINEKKYLHRRVTVSRLIEDMNDSTLFWRQIRQICTRRGKVCHLPENVWFDHFREVFQFVNPENTSPVEELTSESSEEELSYLNADITVDEITIAIGKLKRGRAAGPDEVLAEMLKCSTYGMKRVLCRFFNAVFFKGQFPMNWTRSSIVPIFKKGDPTSPDNYRGICLSSVFSKVYTSIITKRIQDWAEAINIIDEEQAGFRRGYSTIDNMFILHSIVHRYLDRKRKLYVAFVDFRKAFDTVDRLALWKILEMYGMNGRMLNCLKGMYSSVWYCVKCNGRCTDAFECKRGLKQGCKASPIIFSLLISYVAKIVKKKGKHGVQLMPDSEIIYLLMFADDIALISDTVTGLQNQLNVLVEESGKLGLIANSEKTKIVVFRNGGFLAGHEKWFLGEKRLDVVNEFKYLGAVFSTRLSFQTMQLDLIHRARAGMLQVMRCQRKLGCISPDLFFKLFDVQVGPVLLYSSELWGLKDCPSIESVHLQALKRFLHLPFQTPNVIAYGETGRYPISVTAKMRAIKYWLRILQMDSSRYPRKVYNMMLQSCKTNWATDIESVLCRYGFEQVWREQSVGNMSGFLRDLRGRLIADFVHNWSSKLGSSLRYDFYRQFKDVFKRELYLYHVDKQVFRDALIRFRSGFSELYVHKYRFLSDSPSSYTCPACNEEDEDEDHFLIRCHAYEDLRNKYILGLDNVENRLDVHDIMANESLKSLRSTAMFVYFAFKRRQTAIQTVDLLSC